MLHLHIKFTLFNSKVWPHRNPPPYAPASWLLNEVVANNYEYMCILYISKVRTAFGMYEKLSTYNSINLAALVNTIQNP